MSVSESSDGAAAIVIIQSVVPNLEGRMEQYRVDTSEVDDELMELFLQQIEGNIEILNTALSSSDVTEIAQQAHSVKGMGGTAGMPELSVLSEEIEKAAKADDMEQCRILIAKLVEWLAAFKAERTAL